MEDIKKLLKSMKKYRKKKKTKAEIIKHLMEVGIVDKDGNLTEYYKLGKEEVKE